MSDWTGRTYDLGKMNLRDLLVAYASHRAIHVYAAIAVAGAIAAVALTEDGWRTALAALVIVVLYPFVEYGLHRFILHGRFLYKSRLTAALWKRVHFDHHQDPHDLRVLFGSLANTLPMILVVALPIGWAVDGLPGAAAALACATTLMCIYEFCHCMQHLNVKPRNRLLLRIKQLHLAHHFHDENSNFGITSHLVDRIAGSYVSEPRQRPRSPTVFNLGYDAEEAKRYPWVATLTGSPPRDRPPGPREEAVSS
ncbi:sterol desaturase family protein [Arenibaculum pallidiluteum]|uniref:sterol desaturase family protein n=1 Tax=Arenibaculum pallidiluteum TaxID=2812559 RepID=UPI001F221FAA|nr:sterol desaturase family protein [Arenibaculum pallidiluteum]